MATSRKPLECEFCGVHGDCFFEDILPDGVLAELRERRTSLHLRRGEVLFREGEPAAGLYITCSGRVKIDRRTREGKHLITRLCATGDLFGHRAMLADESYEETATALEDSVVAFLDKGYVTSLLSHHGELALKLLRSLARDLGDSEAAATAMAYRSARERLVEALFDLHELQLAHPDASGGGPWQFSLRRQDLAELTGLTLETTVRALKELEREGVLRLVGRTIDVEQPAKVLAAVGVL